MESKGIEGYNRLTQLLRPYRDLRGFYFGVRSVLHKMCKPTEGDETTYSQIREIKMQRKGDGLYIDYRPFRKQNILRAYYAANTHSVLLKPLKHPAPHGEEQLGGYFDKNSYNLILPVMEDVIAWLKSNNNEFKQRESKCPNDVVGVIKRVVNREKDTVILSYRCYLRGTSGKEVPSEEIRFFIS